MTDRFVSISLEEIAVGEPLPAPLYLYLHHKFIVFRGAGDCLGRQTYERLELQKVHTLFVAENDLQLLRDWCVQFDAVKQMEPVPQPVLPLEAFNKFSELRKDMRREMLDIFQTNHPEPIIAQALETSKKLVFEIIKFPYAAKTLEQLQLYSQGTVNHSVNVSVLSVYLASQMGYAHATTLQQLGSGGLLHDIGKARISISEDDTEEEVLKKLEIHPSLGVAILETYPDVPFEIKTIVAQHHEAHDGSGFPTGLRGHAIHELSKIVAIANAFDNFMAEKSDPLPVRQRYAVKQLEEKFYSRFDPQKLDRALRILQMGI